MRALTVLLAIILSTSSSAAVTDWSSAERIEVTLSNFAFTPRSLHLHAGRPYLLHFVNAGSGGHNFTAQEFFKAGIYPSGVAPDGGAIELANGASADVTLLLPAPGRYKTKCTHLFHSTLGMAGEIIVE